MKHWLRSGGRVGSVYKNTTSMGSVGETHLHPNVRSAPADCHDRDSTNSNQTAVENTGDANRNLFTGVIPGSTAKGILENLQRQIKAFIAFCRQHQINEPLIVQDVSSGLNAKRHGLITLFHLVEQGRIARVVLTYPDRLTRFGFAYLEYYFRSFHDNGVEIITLNQEESLSAEQELMNDLIAILTSFSGRVNGLRSHSNKKLAQTTT